MQFSHVKHCLTIFEETTGSAHFEEVDKKASLERCMVTIVKCEIVSIWSKENRQSRPELIGHSLQVSFSKSKMRNALRITEICNKKPSSKINAMILNFAVDSVSPKQDALY